MTPQQVSKDIARGIEIRAQLDQLKAELKTVETRLRTAADESPHLPLEEEEREGRQALLTGAGHILPVRYTSDSLIASLDPDGQAAVQLREIAGERLPLFYEEQRKLVRVPKDGVEFRRVARAQLPPVAAALLVSAATQRDKNGIARSSVVIAWEDIRPA